MGEDLDLAPDGDDVRLRRDELCHSLLARLERHERTHEDNELTVVHAVAEGGPVHIQHDLLPRVSKVRQALGTAVATLALNPSSRPISFSHPGRPSPFSLVTLRSAPDSPTELVRLATRF